MRSSAYRNSLLKRISYYRKSRKRLHIQSRVFKVIGIIGFLIIFLGYTLFTDNSLGLNSIPFETCMTISIIGFFLGVLGITIGLKLQSELDEIQMKLDRIDGMVIR